MSRAVVLDLLKLYSRRFCECTSVCVCMESFSQFPGIKGVFAASKCSVLVYVSVKADFMEHCEERKAQNMIYHQSDFCIWGSSTHSLVFFLAAGIYHSVQMGNEFVFSLYRYKTPHFNTCGTSDSIANWQPEQWSEQWANMPAVLSLQCVCMPCTHKLASGWMEVLLLLHGAMLKPVGFLSCAASRAQGIMVGLEGCPSSYSTPNCHFVFERIYPSVARGV